MKKAKTIMIQGTGSGVGKSVLVSALCRIFLQDGYRVAPFKAQNMALNSYVTEDGGEIGRAQATQSQACRIKPTVDMNPILIKPTSQTSAQIILHGKPVKNMSVYEYKDYKKPVFNQVQESLEQLRQGYEIVVIEGAGSPAEINLKRHDIVNMKIAKIASAPVILVGDIDRGGVFAWLIGTLQLLTDYEKRMVKGFIINKFRGDKRLLKSGIKFLERYTGIKVLGIIPYFEDIKIPEEDSATGQVSSTRQASTRQASTRQASLKNKKKGREVIDIAVIRLPHISNFTDFDALENEPDVSLRYVHDKEELYNPDVTIIPGTKNTIEDLNYLKRSGLAQKIISNFESQPKKPPRSNILIGICGGYQILGEWIYDLIDVESKRKKRIRSLGILPIITQMCPEKILSQVKARDLSSGIEVIGYEIHHGRSEVTKEIEPMFEISEFMNKVGVKKIDGARIQDEKAHLVRCWGTYIHGVFDNDTFRRNFLNDIRARKGMPPLTEGKTYNVDLEINKLSALVRENINLDLLYEILDGGK
ncbi:MAG: cobyric acid synthase [bacterium]|nr:cobyric acid synthase [bacterium]